MKKLGTFLVIAVAAIGLSAAGCKKKKENAGGGSGTAAVGTGSGTAAAGTGSGTAAGTGAGTAAGTGAGTAAGTGAGTAVVAPAAAVDHIKVVAQHVDAAKGPVDVVFNKWAVTKASFDPANLEGGTAEIEVDIASLTTGIGDRDTHLQSPDLFDVAKFAKATVKIDNVKKASETSYTADATFSIHGVEKKVPTKFEVTASTADSVTVKVSQPINRNDFGVGGVPDKVQADVVLDVQLTLKKI